MQQLFRRGDRGPAVAEIRAKLERLGRLDPVGGENLTNQTDILFDDVTDYAVRSFQQERGLRVDGVVGPETYRALDEAHWRFGDRLLSYRPGHPFIGDDVTTLQQRLLDMGFDPGRCDGIFGRATEAALQEFQRNVGLRSDGALGPGTLRALEQLRRTVTGGSPSARREEERLRRGHGALAGRIIVLDPGHGGSDGGVAANDLVEAEIVLDLAARIEGRLGALGVTTYLTRSADTCPDDRERAQFANDMAAEIFVSLHLDAMATEHASGAACFYYGASRHGRHVRSAVGERLADLIGREVATRTDLVDGRVHPMTWELLRLTRMPAVRLDAGYLTSPSDAARLATPEFRDALAEAVVAGIQRLYLPEHLDVPTGQFRMPALSN
ncbi:MAG: N-acetylmuramoyl-L-alanine amidase [Frankiaceae bacterium]|nr:N-acetylmuramoyl-L-alanine amidase [Frankiaceae bacterium]MBV9870354.1 N-acetylmuramoyl-L-alanine amidase [Frankiaceae bacterium]